jgi:MFS family permease
MAPAIQSWANGMVVGAAVFGIASTYYLVGMLMDAIGWPGVFLVSGLATLAVTTLWWLAIPGGQAAASPAGPSPNGPGETSGASPIPASDGDGVQAGIRRFLSEMIPLFRNRSLMLVTISYGAFGYFQYLFFYWMQYYFDDTLKMSKADGRLFATIPSLAMALGMIAGGFLCDRLQRLWGVRWGRASVQIATMLGAALFALIGVNLVAPVSVVICFALAMGLLGMSEGPFWSAAVDLGGRRGGLAAAIFNTGGNLGGSLAPYLTPLIGEAYGWQYAIGLACLFCLVGAILWFWITPARPEDS